MLRDRPTLELLLIERGVERASEVVDAIPEGCVDSSFDVVRYYDEHAGLDAGAGLLVQLLRKGEMAGYRQRHERTKVDSSTEGNGIPTSSLPVTARLLQAVRGTCKSPNGSSRDEVRSSFEAAARARGLSADALIDQAMGGDWQVTPPIPAFDEERADRGKQYERWVSEGCKIP